ncbi:MAG TPA: hypothetical protein VK731_04235 [Candidatus Cybelea sp.]|jgi:hypothetical protein|nr:hypothetical protein [Candidatus Cybelea sp.]
MPIGPNKAAKKLRQAEIRLAARMAKDQAGAAEMLRQEVVKAAEKRRQMEMRLAARMAEDAAKEAEMLARVEDRKEAKLAKARAKVAKKYWRHQLNQRGIKIDLLAEAREAEERRRNHPIKRAAWIAGFCVSVMLLWLLELQLAINLSQMKSRNLEKRYGAVRRRDSAAKDYIMKNAEINKRVAALDRLETNRFLWAPLLNALQKTMIDDIQVTRMSGEQKYTAEGPRTIGAGSRKAVVPGDIVERISLSIEAMDVSRDELSYIKYKESLDRCDYFVKNLGGRDGFILEGVLMPAGASKLDPSNRFTKFVLGARFPELRRSEYVR